jgi:hypothetical protein
VAISNTYWPLVWPSPETVTLTVFAGASGFILPVRAPRAEDAKLPELPPEESAQPMARTTLVPGGLARTLDHVAATDEYVETIANDSGTYRIDAIDLEFSETSTHRWSVRSDDPLSARGETAATVRRKRGAWSIRTETRTVMSVTKDTWVIAATLEAFEGERRVFSRTWDTAIPRDLG